MQEVLGAATAAMLVLGAGQASAHAFLKTAMPRVGSKIAEPPTQVVIDFTEELEPHFSTLQVFDAQGRRVDKADAHVAPHDATRFSVDLKPLTPGSYKVVWHATSVDTHKTQGSYTFTVAP